MPPPSRPRSERVPGWRSCIIDFKKKAHERPRHYCRTCRQKILHLILLLASVVAPGCAASASSLMRFSVSTIRSSTIEI
jgi:hypothetical protein